MDSYVSTDVPTTKLSWPAERSPDAPNGHDPVATMQGNSPPYPGEYLAGEKASSPNYFRKMLPPGPRVQDPTDPDQTQKYSKFFQNRYQRGTLYHVVSPNQNIVGLVDGGPSNANWVRGNQFGNNYSYKNIWGRPKHELKALPEAPQTLANIVPSPFYPFPTFFDRYDRQYKTYPDQRSSYFGFLPFYTYPHNTIDNKDRESDEPNELTKPQLADTVDTVEGFANKIMQPIPLSSLLVVSLLVSGLFIYKMRY